MIEPTFIAVTTALVVVAVLVLVVQGRKGRPRTPTRRWRSAHEPGLSRSRWRSSASSWLLSGQ
ncbi:hypothetical protein ENKNEFLB_02360 [Nocardioides aquaticus]|uniref:Uncharacterized protein n=1 Tax=Nocardioides aquaticus TaxID=160826 RepID=A0ABX8EJ90_9ACTN|nr:hypothetical protein [Nocardioides aquaticus]QVT79970.1 hypothetical protein ENKNEFLB_02360 [Nocardioides aquaticus]